MPELDIKSETIDKAVDKLVEPVYKDVAQPIIKSTGSALSFCSQFIVSRIKPFMYFKIKESEYKIKEIDIKLAKKYEHIPDENKTEPRTNILGPAVDVLKYNLQEEHIKEMFVNLIGNDMDKTKQTRVLPSYIEIVKQLSKDDAEFLCYLKNKYSMQDIPLIRLKLVNNDSTCFSYVSTDCICMHNDEPTGISPIVLDNLIRLKLVEIPFDEFIANTSIYSEAFDKLKNSFEFHAFNQIPNKHLDYQSRMLKITNFGRNFIDICLS